MVMLRRMLVKQACLAGCLALLVALLAGCGTMSSGQFEAILADLVGSNAILADSVKIRIVNQSSSVLSLEVSVDGVVDTITCEEQEICETALGYCPNEIRLLNERRFDEDGTFLGGQDFEDIDVYTLTGDEFDCDETVIFKFTESTTDILIL